MGDIILRSLAEVAEAARTLYQQRGAPVEDHHLAGGWEVGEPPEGHLAAWQAGAIPPWPGARHDGRLLESWWALRRSTRSGRMGPQPETMHCGKSQVPNASNSGAAGFGASRWEGSPNWSGAVLTAHDGERFTAVSGRWKVPDARPAAADATPPIDGPEGAPPSRRCSVWIGLDGHRAAFGSLPQIGTTTAEIFAGGPPRVQCHAWAQWWVRGEQHGEWVFLDLPVKPGDEISAWMALQAPDRAVFRIRNETAKREDGVIWRSGKEVPDAVRAIHDDPAPVPGQAAVWCVERPMVMGRTDLYPLPAFDRVEFRDCIAAVRAPGQPFHAAADLRDLTGARFIRMFDQRPDPWRSRRTVMPEVTPGDRLGFALRHAG